MAIRKFLTSVADVYGYDNKDTLLFTGKTLLDSSIETSLGSAPVRGGRGNQLQYIYYHTGEMKIALTETQWNLAFLGYTVGSAPSVTSSNVAMYLEESIEVDSGSATAGFVLKTIANTALVWLGLTTIYGWATTTSGNTFAGTFDGTGKTFSSAAAGSSTDPVAPGDKVCVRFYAYNADATYIRVNANMIPSVVKLVMETQLNSADVTTNKIGIVQIIVPTATLSGAFTIAMKADGVSNTPLSATALSYSGVAGVDACVNEPYYAEIIEIIDSANWYDNIIGLSVIGGDFSLATGDTATLNVYAIPSSGSAFKAPLGGEIDFAVSDADGTGMAIDASTGLIDSQTTTGTATINVHIHDVSTVDTTVLVTVTT